MAHLTFYGEINEIGENKILLEDENLVIYQETIASKYPSLWLRNICQEYNSKIDIPAHYLL